MRQIAIILLMLFAFAVPWEYALDFGEPFGNIARIAGLLTLLFTIPCCIESGKIRRPGALQWLVLLLYMFFAASYFWSIDPTTTLGKIRAYFQVMMTVWLVWELVDTPREMRNLLRAFVAGCWVLAILTLINYTSADTVNSDQIRFVAEGQDPNDVARFLDLGLPIATLLFATETRRIVRSLALLYIPVGLLAVLLTASRGGFSASVLAMIGSGILLIRWRPRAAAATFAGLAVACGLFWITVPLGTMARLGTIPEQLASSDWNDRMSIWSAGWHAFARSPWLGSGAGNYAIASGLGAGDTAHNTLMAILVTGGVGGATIFLSVIALVAALTARTQALVRIAMAVTLAVWVITGMVGSVEENRATWFLFAIISSAARLSPDPRWMLTFGNCSAKPLHVSGHSLLVTKAVQPS